MRQRRNRERNGDGERIDKGKLQREEGKVWRGEQREGKVLG